MSDRPAGRTRGCYAALPASLLLSFCATAADVSLPITGGDTRERATVPAPLHRRVLTLPEALELARRHNADLSAASREVDATDAAREQAASYPNPQLSADVEGTQRNTRTTTVLLSQTIELGGKHGARIALAERERDIAAVQRAMRRADVRATVEQAFFEALIAQDRVLLAEAAAALAATGAQVATRRVEAGKVSPIEQTRAKVAEAGVRIELVRARGDLQAAFGALQAAIGSRDLGIERVEGFAVDLPPSASRADLTQQTDEAPALLLARAEVERRTARLDLERARRIPDLTVRVGAKRDETLGINQAVIGLSVPLPLFDTNRGNIVEALRRQDKARDEADAATTRLRTDVQRAASQLDSVRAEVELLRQDVLPGAQSAYDATRTGFELGKFSFLEALDAQRTLLQARSQLLTALSRAYRARADLDRILGIDERDTSAASVTTGESR